MRSDFLFLFFYFFCRIWNAAHSRSQISYFIPKMLYIDNANNLIFTTNLISNLKIL